MALRPVCAGIGMDSQQWDQHEQQPDAPPFEPVCTEEVEDLGVNEAFRKLRAKSPRETPRADVLTNTGGTTSAANSPCQTYPAREPFAVAQTSFVCKTSGSVMRRPTTHTSD